MAAPEKVSEADNTRAWLIVANEVLRLNPKQIKAMTETERTALVIGLRGFTASQTCTEACAKLDKANEKHS
jgi:hypothetical protein